MGTDAQQVATGNEEPHSRMGAAFVISSSSLKTSLNCGNPQFRIGAVAAIAKRVRPFTKPVSVRLGFLLLNETTGSDGSGHRAVHRSNQHRDPRLSGNFAA